MAPDFLGPSLLPQERPGLSPSFRPRCLLCHCCASLPLPSSFGWSFRLCSGCCASGPQRTGPCRPQPTWCAAPTAACICLRPRRSPATACTSAANSILNNTARVDRRATGRQTFRRRRPLRSVRSPVLAAPTASSVHPCRGRCKVSAYPIRNRALDERYRMLDFSHTAARPLGADDDTGRRQTWKPLALLNVYRLVLSGLLTFIALTHIELTPLGEYHPLLFVAISVAYFLMALLFTVTLRARVPNFTLQLHAQRSGHAAGGETCRRRHVVGRPYGRAVRRHQHAGPARRRKLHLGAERIARAQLHPCRRAGRHVFPHRAGGPRTCPPCARK